MSTSFWLESAEPRAERAQLRGAVRADVCVIGGGYTGLWTALELRRADPSLEIVVLEAEHAGFGASGRNGGWVLGKLAGSASGWRRRGGAEGPRRMAAAITTSVAEVGAAVAREAIDCDWVHGGSLTVAQSRPQRDRLELELAAERAEVGEGCATRLLDPPELEARIAIRGGLGALFTPHCARVQPARLVAGLAAAAERAGARIYEGSRVIAFDGASARTAAGTVHAERIVLATEAYTADLPGRRRRLLPLGSAMIVTEPLPGAVWETVGWAAYETVLDGAHLYTYSQRTADGRIAIGGRGVPYRFGSRTEREGPVPAATVAQLRRRLADLLELTQPIAVGRAWHGVLGVARDWCPAVGIEPRTGIAYAGGYAGDGVAASNLAGRTLRDLILGRDTELTALPWVGTPARDWEPEPLRFLGARGVHRLLGWADRREAITGRRSPLAAVANAVAGR